MEKIQSIELVFENLEICKLETNMFKRLIINGIKESIGINCYQYENGEINKGKSCEEFIITINKNALKQELCSGTLKEKLRKYKDIVSVIIHYKDKSEEIYVPWNDIDDFSNEYQEIEETEAGIKVKISKETE